MGNTVKLLKNWEEEAGFKDPALMCMVSLTEACYMWEKSPTAMRHAWWKGHISGRRSFTGGEIYLTYHSIVKHYGQPKKDVLSWLQSQSPAN